MLRGQRRRTPDPCLITIPFKDSVAMWLDMDAEQTSEIFELERKFYAEKGIPQ